MKHALILTGGMLDLEFATSYLANHSFDIVIAADKGVEAAIELNLKVNYILGDFDSLEPKLLKKIRSDNYLKENDIILKEFPPEKDYTDTHLAMEIAIELGVTNVTILGATGTRFDHTIANINLLATLLDEKIEAKIVDPHNSIYVINEDQRLIKKQMHGSYLSLIAYTDRVEGITLTGFKYPLNNATLVKASSLGISNELLEEEGTIKLLKGMLIVIEARD